MNKIMDKFLNFPKVIDPDKKGWPWDASLVESKNFPSIRCLPFISIITPSFNQGKFIEETIRSILLQNYPKLQYIIIDGGSTDETLAILNKYSSWIDLVISEPDFGQSDAINKGWKFATGEITTWINSDDYLAPNCLFEVAKLASLDSCKSLIIGNVINFSGINQSLIRQRNINLKNVLFFWSNLSIWHQPGIFFPLESIRRVGYLDTTFHYSMDSDLLCKILSFSDVIYSNKVFTHFRIHDNSKGVSAPSKTINEKLVIFLQNRNRNNNLNSFFDYFIFFIWLTKFLLKSKHRFNLNFRLIYLLIFNK